MQPSIRDDYGQRPTATNVLRVDLQGRRSSAERVLFLVRALADSLRQG
jgi:hypothetical protein